MSIQPKKTTYGHRPDRRALVTEHALSDGIGCTLTASAFASAAGVTDGIVPALYPIVVDADGMATPWTTGALSGFTINVNDVNNGDTADGYIWHGALDPDLLPVAFDPATVTGSHQFNFNGKA